MMKHANEIKYHICNTIDVLIQTLSNDNTIDDYLNHRDSAEFDSKWVKAYQDMWSWIYQNQDIGANHIDFKENESKLRETIFKMIVSKVQHYELAGYVSDDAGLIYANLLFGCDNLFINQLYQSYQSNQLPT